MDRKLTSVEKEALRELKSWQNGYMPSAGSPLVIVLNSLCDKSYAHKGTNGRYYTGKQPKGEHA